MDKPATPLPWAYRPQEHDDWGIIRMSGRDEDGFMRVVCRVNYVASPEELSAHRMAGTDPAGKDAAYIVHACNAYPRLTAINAQLVEVIANLLEYGKPSCPRGMAEWPRAMEALARAKENSNGH